MDRKYEIMNSVHYFLSILREECKFRYNYPIFHATVRLPTQPGLSHEHMNICKTLVTHNPYKKAVESSGKQQTLSLWLHNWLFFPLFGKKSNRWELNSTTRFSN